MESTSNVMPLVSPDQDSFQFTSSPAGAGEAFLVANVLPNRYSRGTVENIYEKIASVLSDTGMEIVHERIFGSLSVSGEVLDARKSVQREGGFFLNAAPTYIEGHPPWGEGMAGMIVHAVSRIPQSEIWTIRNGETPCGRGWKRNDATFLLLQNIHGLEKGPETINTPPIQTWRMIERAERILDGQGASYRDVARTWFYLSRILDWYDDFNRVRSDKYRSFELMPGPGKEEILLPASTGISGDNIHGAAAVLDLLAVIKGEDTDLTVRQLTNTRQKDAVRYGSAFSRGALILSPNFSSVQVSGTAAIDEQGKSLYPDDIRSQIDCTLDTIEALLEPVDAGLEDISAASVFVKNSEDAAVFQDRVARLGIDPFPGVTVVADICRSELLFEIDAEVVYNSPAI